MRKVHYCDIGYYGDLVPNGWSICDGLSRCLTSNKNKVTCKKCLEAIAKVELKGKCKYCNRQQRPDGKHICHSRNISKI